VTLSLALLVPRVRADHTHHAFPAYDAAPFTPLGHRSRDLHYPNPLCLLNIEWVSAVNNHRSTDLRPAVRRSRGYPFCWFRSSRARAHRIAASCTVEVWSRH